MNTIGYKYRLFTQFIARIFGFVQSGVIHVFFTSAIIIAAFGYGYISITIPDLPEIMKYLLIASVSVAVLIHMYLSDTFYRLKLRSPIYFVKFINDMLPKGRLRLDGDPKDYHFLHSELVKFPIKHTAMGFFDIAIAVIPLAIYDLFFLKSGNFAEYLIIGLYLLPIHCQYCYHTSDLYLGRYRSMVKRFLWQSGEKFEHQYSGSIKQKFIFLVLSIIIIGVLLINLASAGIDNEYTKLMAASAVLLFMSLAVMFYQNIKNYLEDIAMASTLLIKQEDPDFFTSTSDKELAQVAEGIFEATQRQLNYQKDLQDDIKTATDKLTRSMQSMKRREQEMSTELNFAAEIQKGMMPEPKPWNGVNFCVTNLPMGKVTGDYYDFFQKGDHCFVLIADVSGHGIPAALVTMAAKQTFSREASSTHSPANVLLNVNNTLYEQIKTQEYLTAFLLKLTDEHSYTYSNGSHRRGFHYHAAVNECTLMDSKGAFIGAMPENEVTFDEGYGKLEPGDRIVLYTDGIVEARNERGEEFGEKRLEAIINETSNLPIKSLNERVMTELFSFLDGEPVGDDITIITSELSPKWSDFRILCKAGDKELRKKHFRRALSIYKKANALVQSYPPLLLILCRLCFYNREYDASDNYGKLYLSMVPNEPLPIRLLMRIAQKNSKRLQMRKYAAQLLEIFPKDKEATAVLDSLRR